MSTDVRALAAALLAGRGEAADEELLQADPALADELAGRFDAVGARLVRRVGEAPLVVIPEDDDALPAVALSCLAACVLSLGDGAPGRARPRVSVHELWEAHGKPNGFTEAYLRRVGLGPLEQRGLIRVVRPDGRAQDAYVVPGSALRAIDADQVRARLEALVGGAA